MMFEKTKLCYCSKLYVLYVYLRIRETVMSVWKGIRNILTNAPVELRKQLLNEVN